MSPDQTLPGEVPADGEPRWLTPDERAAWLALMSAMQRLQQALDRELRRDAGISHFDYQVLASLSEAPERSLRMSQLAYLADGSLSRLSQVVARLERRGWVLRRPDPHDGRITLATLTDDGWDFVVRIAPGHVGAVRQAVFDHLTTPQVAQLRKIATGIANARDDPAQAPRY